MSPTLSMRRPSLRMLALIWTLTSAVVYWSEFSISSPWHGWARSLPSHIRTVTLRYRATVPCQTCTFSVTTLKGIKIAYPEGFRLERTSFGLADDSSMTALDSRGLGGFLFMVRHLEPGKAL